MEENKKTVLVVEDNINLRTLIANKLELEGLEILVAETAQQGEKLIREKRPNLILLDIMLPGGMNGFDLLEMVKRDPILKTIPVIVLTNLNTEETTAMKIGAIDYVVKADVSLDDIALKVKNHLQ